MLQKKEEGFSKYEEIQIIKTTTTQLTVNNSENKFNSNKTAK